MVTRYVSFSAFASLAGIPEGTKSSPIKIKLYVTTALLKTLSK